MPGIRIKFLHFGTPGHATNDIGIWLPQERILFTGDLAFNGGTPFALSGPIGGWLDVLTALSELDPAVVIPIVSSAIRGPARQPPRGSQTGRPGSR